MMMLYRVLYLMALLLSLVAGVCVAEEASEEASSHDPQVTSHREDCKTDVAVEGDGMCPESPPVVQIEARCQPDTKCPVAGAAAALKTDTCPPDDTKSCLQTSQKEQVPPSELCESTVKNEKCRTGSVGDKANGTVQGGFPQLTTVSTVVVEEQDLVKEVHHGGVSCDTVSTDKTGCSAGPVAPNIAAAKNPCASAGTEDVSCSAASHSQAHSAKCPDGVPRDGDGKTCTTDDPAAIDAKEESRAGGGSASALKVSSDSKVLQGSHSPPTTAAIGIPTPQNGSSDPVSDHSGSVVGEINNHGTNGKEGTTGVGPAAPALIEPTAPSGGNAEDSQIKNHNKDTTQAETTQTTGAVTGDVKETSTTASHNNQAVNGTGEANNVANTNSDTPRIQTPVTQDSQSSNGTGETNNSANTNTDADTPSTISNEESTTTTTTTTTTLPPSVPTNSNKKPNVKGDADSSSSMSSSVWVRLPLLMVVALACILV